ncbi:hypothetical protein A3Q56_04252 [Intoshia linei]|uniref:Uncharacterized protein n=1 Tax=Intoshia linei TaxID=1819745 RepID=A0A177B3M9_9BILA|nr:hypothetical protein A3Q56_04252 [Intoshia linei]
MKFKLRDAINSICKRFLSGLHVEISDDLITGNVFKTDRGYEILYDNYGNVIIGECSPEIKMLKYKYPLTTFKCIVPKCEHDE